MAVGINETYVRLIDIHHVNSLFIRLPLLTLIQLNNQNASLKEQGNRLG